MQVKNIGLKRKSLISALALTLFFVVIFSLSSCSSAIAVASLKDDGSLEYEGVSYTKINEQNFSILVFDTEKMLGKVEGAEHTNLYTLRYAKDKTFLCTQNLAKEKILYIAEGEDFAVSGRRTTEVLMQYKNAFIKNVENSNDFNSVLRLDMIKGEDAKISLDINADNWVSIFSCYDSSPVASVWFGTLVKKGDDIYYVLPDIANKGIIEVFNDAENIEEIAKTEYTCRLIEGQKELDKALKITGLV